jgi:hypothetical protein
MTRRDVLLVELHVGTRGMFAAAGFAEVSRPTLRRVVMRIDFSAPHPVTTCRAAGSV